MRAIFKRKLTSLDATRLRPKVKTFLIWDSAERGLALQIRPSGYRAFKFIYHHRGSGETRWITIGAADTVSLDSAREQATAFRLQVHQGRDPATERRAARGGNATGTFSVIASRYVAEYAQKRNKSWRQAATLVTRYVLPVLGVRDASTITRADVRAMLAKIDAPILHNQVLASASAIFTWAGKQEILTNNPCKGVERNAVTSRERVLSDQELPLFWSSFGLAGLSGEALKVLLLTGQRPGEISHIRFEHLSSDGWWTLPGQPVPALGWPGTKNAQTHRVYLPQRVQDMIAELNSNDGDGTGFVFGQVLDLSAPMRDICKQLSVPRITPHDLRRTNGTTITGLGFGREAMNRIQNHKEGGIADVYDRHQYSEENIRIMEAVAAKILSLAENTSAPTNVVALR